MNGNSLLHNYQMWYRKKIKSPDIKRKQYSVSALLKQRLKQ